MASERVVLIAEIKDEATADLKKIQGSIDATQKKVADAEKKTKKATGGTRSALGRLAGGAKDAFNRFGGSVRSGLDRAGSTLSGFGNKLKDSDGKLARFGRGSMSALQKGLGGVSRAVGPVVSSVGGIGTALGKGATVAGRAASKVGGIAVSAGKAGAGIASNIVSTLADGVGKAGKLAGVLGGLVVAEGLRGGLSRAMNIEDAEARMRGMNYEADEISELMDNASDAIMGTAYRLDDAATASAQFSAAGIESGEDMERVIGLVGDSAFAAGTNFDQMGSIWSQVAARGTLDGQTMNRLLDAGVGITAELADKFGVTEGEVKDLVSSGSVSFEDFAEVMEGKVGGAAQEMADTTRGALMNVQAGLHMLGAEVSGPFMQLFRGSFNRLQEPLFAMAEVVSPVFTVLEERAEEWGDKMFEAGEGAGEGIRKLVEPMEEVSELMREGTPMMEAFAEVFDIDTDSGFLGFLSDALDLMQDLSPIGGILSGVADSAGDIFDPIMASLKEVAPIIGEAFQEIGAALGPLLVVLAEAFGDIVTTVGPSLVSIVGVIAEAIGALMPSVLLIVETLAGGLADVFSALLPVIETLVEAVAEVLEALAPVIALIVDVVVDVVVELVEVVAPIIEELAGLIADAIVELLPIITPVLELIGDMLLELAPIFGDLLEAVLPLVEVILDLALTWMEMLLPVMEPMSDLVLTIVKAVLELAVALMPLLPLFLELAFKLVEPLLELLVELAPLIAETLTWAIAELMPFIIWLIEGVVDLVGWFMDFIDETEETESSVVSSWEAIKDGVMPVIEWFLEEALPWMQDVWDGIVEGYQWLDEKLTTGFQWISDQWGAMVETIQTWWEETLKPVLTAIGDFFVMLWEDYLSPVLSWISEKWDTLVTFMVDLWNETLWPMLQGLGDTAVMIWEDYLAPAFDSISGAWETLTDTVSRIWNENLKPVFQAVGDFVMEDVVGMIASGVEAIENTWNTVANLFRKPINWVIDTVWNKGIKRAFDGVADVVGYDGKRIPEIGPIGEFGGSSGAGSRPPGFAEGGLAPRGWALVGEEGPELVNFSAPGRVYTADETRDALTGGTDANPPKGIGAPSAVKAGMWLATSDNAVAESARDTAAGAISWVRGKFADTAEGLIDPLVESVTGWLSGAGKMGDLAGGLMSWGVDSVMDWIRGEDAKAVAGGQFDGEFTANPGGFNRPAQGIITSSAGARAYQGAFGGMHYGVDIGNSIGTAVRAAWSGVVKQVSGSGMDRRLVLNHGSYDTAYLHNSDTLVGLGDEVTGGQKIARMGTAGTGPHLHFEYHPGGWYNPSIGAVNGLFDGGGVLPPGDTLASNNTGLNEYVLTNSQFGQMTDVLDSVHDQIPIGAGGSAGSTMVDQRVTVEEGAVQINVEAGPDGHLTPEGYEAMRDAINEIFEESRRRDY